MTNVKGLITLSIMDGLSGLEKVFEEEFPHAKIQRCQVHVTKNVLAKVPRKLKKEVADDLRSIFYASSRKKAEEFAVSFAAKWEKDLPSAVKCLANSLGSCLTFFSFPEEEWMVEKTDYANPEPSNTSSSCLVPAWLLFCCWVAVSRDTCPCSDSISILLVCSADC